MLTTRDASAPTTHDSFHTLDSLAQRSLAELDALYRAGSVPTTIRALDGALVGRMLAVRGVPSALQGPLGKWAASEWFVWEGKTFAAFSDAQGVGHNRVFIPGVLGRQNVFPFETSFGSSALDGKPALILDYDLVANPGWIRHVHDEIREVAPGLYLGPAMWKGDKEKVLVLWFALEARFS